MTEFVHRLKVPESADLSPAYRLALNNYLIGAPGATAVRFAGGGTFSGPRADVSHSP